MGRLTASLSLLALAAVALGACGSSGSADLLPGTTASQITANLDEVERQVGEGECIGAENSAAEIGTQVEELSGVDARLKQALAEGVSRLTETVTAECEEEPEEEAEITTSEPAEEEEESEAKPKHEKAEKPEKPEKDQGGEEPEEAPESEGPTLPPPSNGKGEENGQGNGPPTETGPPSGGVGPGTPAEEE
jgi:hypothetical protein